jgi:hypothetical protein
MRINIKTTNPKEQYEGILSKETLDSVLTASKSNLSAQINKLFNESSSNNKVLDLTTFKAVVESKFPLSKIKEILTSIITSVHLKCFDTAEDSTSPYNNNKAGVINVQTSTITVNNCNGFKDSQEASDIVSNQLKALNLLAKAISTYNSQAQSDQKYEMDTFSIDQRCYQNSLNGQLKYDIGACPEDGNSTIEVDKFNNVSINFTSANDYDISYSFAG